MSHESLGGTGEARRGRGAIPTGGRAEREGPRPGLGGWGKVQDLRVGTRVRFSFAPAVERFRKALCRESGDVPFAGGGVVSGFC